MISKSKYGLLLLTVFIMLSINAAGCGQRSYFESVGEASETQDETQDASVSDTDEETSGNEDESKTCFVQVAGEVIKPGVYELPSGSRIYEAIESAGGITELADVRTMNQASLISDGDMIYVPAIGESDTTTVSDSGITADGKVNINVATEEELMTLPGIGASKAAQIVSYRQTNGKFKDTSEIMQISGIKQGVYDQISDLIVAE